jgi:hypothetical protein
MLAGPSDWYSPSGRTPPFYTTEVVDAAGTKVSILDTDHTWGIDPAGDDSPWVWKCLARGHNPIMMDPFTYAVGVTADVNLRAAMGQARMLAARIDLLHMVPTDSASSTGYALVNGGQEYLVYQPANASFTVQLPAGSFDYEWISPVTGQTTATGRIIVTGTTAFSLPAGYTNGGLLYLKAALKPPEEPTPIKWLP